MAETSQTFDLRIDLTAGEVASWMSSLPAHARIKIETGLVGHYTNERTEPVRIRATWARRVITMPLNTSDAIHHLVEHHGVHPVLAQLSAPAKAFEVHRSMHEKDARPEPDHGHEFPFPPVEGTESLRPPDKPSPTTGERRG